LGEQSPFSFGGYMKIIVNKITNRNNDPEWVIINRETRTILSHRNQLCREHIDSKTVIEKFNARLEDNIYIFKTKEDAESALEYIESFLIIEEIIE
jgi:hypothetical protein